MIHQGFTDFQQKLLLFPRVLMEILTHSNFRKLQFHMWLKRIPTIIRRSLENFMGYKVILTYGHKYTALKDSSLSHFSNTMKNSYILTLRLSDMCSFPTESV